MVQAGSDDWTDRTQMHSATVRPTDNKQARREDGGSARGSKHFHGDRASFWLAPQQRRQTPPREIPVYRDTFMSLLLVAKVGTFKHLHHFKLYSRPACCFPPCSLQTCYSLSLVTLAISHISLWNVRQVSFCGLFLKYPGKPDRACILFSHQTPCLKIQNLNLDCLSFQKCTFSFSIHLN